MAGVERASFPLSAAQQRMWLIEHREPGNLAYHYPIHFQLTGELDVKTLTRSLNEIIRRHHSLRTAFPVHQGQPIQSIREFSLHLPLYDLSWLAEDDHALALRQIEAWDKRLLAWLKGR